jgi:hypothetical protein
MKRLFTIILATLIVAGTLNAVHETNNNKDYLRLKGIELKNTQYELDTLEKSYEELRNNTQINEQKRLDEIKRLQDEKAKLEKDLQAKAQVKSTNSVVYAATDGGWHGIPCGVGANNKRAEIKAAVDQLGLTADWTYIDFIFGHESTYDPGCQNSIGCRGLGQACPGSKLPCSSSDVVCQVSFFNDYAQRSHGGGWYNGYQFWLANRWW